MLTKRPNTGTPHCHLCKHHHDFLMPEDVVNAAKSGRLVIFAGAGISTESNLMPMPHTFYEDIAHDLNHDPRRITASFPQLMSEYCNLPNGRRKLLQKLKQRFDYIESFPSLFYLATRFHRELSTIPHFEDIVTTNWDTYFEQLCGATPFVTPQDFVFWDMPGRKVFTLHGSVNNYSSIVATEEDYAQCHEQLEKGLLGSSLKMLLATKIVVFVGYSLRDDDFARIYDFLKSEMQDMLPHAYAVAISNESAERFSSLGLTPIVTDASFFIQILKYHLVADGVMIPDDVLSDVRQAREKVSDGHTRLHSLFPPKRNPETILCACYQDGLSDAFDRMMARYSTGEYSCPDHVLRLIQKYVGMREDSRRRKLYTDVAYIDGYIVGLYFLLLDKRTRQRLPVYYVLGHKDRVESMAQYKKIRKLAMDLHKTAFQKAAKLAAQLPPGLDYHHSPFLL